MIVDLVPATMHHVVSVNQKMHWSQVNATQQFWQGMAIAMFRHQGSFDVPVTITVVFRWPDRRRRDTHNYVPYVVKPIVDGMVKAKVIPDDSDRHVASLDVRAEADPGPFRIQVIVREA